MSSGSERFTFGGTTDPQADFQSARLIPINAQGQDLSPVTSLSANEVHIDNGEISGEGYYGRTPPAGTHGFVLEVTISVPDLNTPLSGRSNEVRLDLKNPFIANYTLTAPDTILVRFSEDVTYPDLSGTGTVPGAGPDWSIDGGQAQVLSVSGSGATRSLTLNKEYSEDATPSVQYSSRAPLFRTYTDEVGRVASSDVNPHLAIDGQIPRPPTVLKMAGKNGANVTANSTDPTIVVGGVTPGHKVQAFRDVTADGQSQDDPAIGPQVIVPSNGQASLDLGDVNEGANRFYVIAFDNSETYSRTSETDQGVPDKTTPSPNASGVSTATYLLDTIVPKSLGIDVVDGNFLRVRFSEGVYGANTVGDWKVGNGTYPVEGVYGDGTTRLLQVRNVPANTPVSFTPPSSGRYTDVAGNPLASFTVITTQAQPTQPTPTPTASGSPAPQPTASPSATPSPSPTSSPSPTPTEDPEPQDRTLTAATELSSAPSGTCQNILVRVLGDGEPLAGENVDAILEDEGITFCGSTGQHDEGFTDADGEIVFSVSSEDGGEFDLISWNDVNDNDKVDTGEDGERVNLSWRVDGNRSIAMEGPRKVRRGVKATLRGTVAAASPTCAENQIVQIVRKRGGDRVIRTARTDSTGSYVAKLRINRAGRYFARLGGYGGCDAVRSRAVRIRVRS